MVLRGIHRSTKHGAAFFRTASRRVPIQRMERRDSRSMLAGSPYHHVEIERVVREQGFKE